jgi:hypothetical protein
MTTRYVLHHRSPDPDVGGGEMATTTSRESADRWVANGGTVTVREDDE